MASDDKKRRLQEEPLPAPVTPVRPPLKKRLTSNALALSSGGPSTSGGMMSPAVGSPIAPFAAEVSGKLDSDALSKEVLLQRMRAVKAEFQRLESESLSLENQELESDAARGLFRTQWCLLRDELSFFTQLLTNANAKDLADPPNETEPLALREWFGKSLPLMSSLEKQVLDYLETWNRKADSVKNQCDSAQAGATQAQATLTEWLGAEVDDLETSFRRGQTLLQEHGTKYDVLQEKSRTMVDKVQRASERLEQAKDSLDECTQKLMQLEKRYDRDQCPTITTLNKRSTANRADSPGERRSRETSVASISKGTRRRVHSESGSLPDQGIKAQLAEHRLIVDVRLKELDALKHEQQQLLAEQERLRDQLARLSFEHLEESDHYRNLQLSCDQYHNRTSDLKQLCTRLEHDLDVSKLVKTEVATAAESDMAKQNERIKSEKNEQVNTHGRVDRKRKEIHKQLQEAKEREKRQKDEHDAKRSRVEAEKRRATVLESRLAKLKTEQAMAGPSPEELTAYNVLYKKLAKQKAAFAHIQDRQPPSHDWSVTSLQQSHASLKTKAEQLEHHISSWTSTNGDTTEMERDIRSAMVKVDAIMATAGQLQLTVEFYEENENLLLEELNLVDAIYNKRDMDTSRQPDVKKIMDFLRSETDKKNQEAARTRRKFPGLVEKRDKHIAEVARLRAERDRYTGMIMQFESQEKGLRSLLAKKESDYQDICNQLMDSRVKLDGLTALCKEREITLRRVELQVSQLRRSFDEKRQALDEENASYVHVEEGYEKMKRRWEMISVGDNPLEQELADECAELRQRLKCSTCNTRFRSRFLERCMHTFCKDCVNARLETRQRRCPSCGESFGASDVRELCFS